ncbi:hypothetical protein FGE12_18480 [Aggregicoccus sp. 17bor-14]|uniref:hypothetical protein n=1 Tax=Myxococcaceae TaxID=31 RepID=UPI00129C7EDE|nr:MULTISPECIES: hypothetical protein [Myxococcaceae]MBF5044392.1 hypothetical protein [Simulacricoccus sp. 17bor-14]MRI90139.1 hypothetical protein [Aggregicoccus sp. 17bor-14]
MKRWTWALAVVALFTGCQDGAKSPAAKRTELRSLDGNTVEFVTTKDQLPFCLLFTVSEKGVVRQLTMTRQNLSIKCDPGVPIGKTTFRIPAEEGKVYAYVFYSDQKLVAGTVAQQIYEHERGGRINAMDFRLPGQVAVETIEFTPQAAPAPTVGGVVGAGGQLKPNPDGGIVAPPAGAADAGSQAQ